jgi:hypothetical protein
MMQEVFLLRKRFSEINTLTKSATTPQVLKTCGVVADFVKVLISENRFLSRNTSCIIFYNSAFKSQFNARCACIRQNGKGTVIKDDAGSVPAQETIFGN